MYGENPHFLEPIRCSLETSPKIVVINIVANADKIMSRQYSAATGKFRRVGLLENICAAIKASVVKAGRRFEDLEIICKKVMPEAAGTRVQMFFNELKVSTVIEGILSDLILDLKLSDRVKEMQLHVFTGSAQIIRVSTFIAFLDSESILGSSSS